MTKTVVTIESTVRSLVEVDGEWSLEQLQGQPVELIWKMGPIVGHTATIARVTEVAHR